MGIYKEPSLQGSMVIYKDPLVQGNVLMGYKGTSYMDSGYFFAPYVPLTTTPMVFDPDGFMSGKKLMEEAAPEPVKKQTYRDIDEPFEVSIFVPE